MLHLIAFSITQIRDDCGRGEFLFAWFRPQSPRTTRSPRVSALELWTTHWPDWVRALSGLLLAVDELLSNELASGFVSGLALPSN